MPKLSIGFLNVVDTTHNSIEAQVRVLIRAGSDTSQEKILGPEHNLSLCVRHAGWPLTLF